MSCSQSDLILIKAIRDGIDFLRAYPFHLDFVFQDANSNVVKAQFGQKEIDQAKRWFLNTNIPVFSTYRVDKNFYPRVTVQVTSSNEDKEHARLGEDYPEGNGFMDPETMSPEGIIKTPNISYGPFTPTYNSTTGLVTLPTSFDTTLIFPGQGLFSPASNETYVITAINSGISFKIATGIVDNFTGSYIVPAYQALHVTRNVALFKEQYEITCAVSGMPGELYWLTAIVSYILLQRRQFVLEQNNINLGTINIGPIQELSDPTATENFFEKNISMEGEVEVSWLQSLDSYIEGIQPVINLVKDSDSTIYSTLEE